MAVPSIYTYTYTQKFFNSLDNASGFFGVSVPFVAMRQSASSGSSSRYGGSFSSISTAMVSRDQLWAYAPYFLSEAIQYGAPLIVACFDF